MEFWEIIGKLIPRTFAKSLGTEVVETFLSCGIRAFPASLRRVGSWLRRSSEKARSLEGGRLRATDLSAAGYFPIWNVTPRLSAPPSAVVP